MTRIARWITVFAFVLALTIPALSVAAAAGEVKLEADLTSTSADTLASGKAKFEMRSDRTRFSTEVEDVTTGGPLTVDVNGNTVGSITLVAGFGDLNLDSRDGQSVPSMGSGELVEVFNADGVLILSGTLGSK